MPDRSVSFVSVPEMVVNDMLEGEVGQRYQLLGNNYKLVFVVVEGKDGKDIKFLGAIDSDLKPEEVFK